MEDLMLNISVRDGNSGSRKKTPKVSKKSEKKSKRYEGGTELPKTLLKKGRNDSQLRLDIAKLGRPLKDKKKKSLQHLLAQEFGDKWEEEEDLQWNKTMLENAGDNLDEDDGNEEECDCLEEDVGLHV
ncbi:hypothetical protein JTB14_032177 [Gonioctena quinquepunctata]|nr:hypothetical protein JTB14_032177 [Gonioctena quinquepunctata]